MECGYRTTHFVAGNSPTLPLYTILQNTEGSQGKMAKRVRFVKLSLTDGTEKIVQVKTTTENFIRKLANDLRISVRSWEVIA